MKPISRKTKSICIALILCVLLIIFSADCMSAALSGFNMWLNLVMPSIFPFFVCMALMRDSGLFDAGRKTFVLTLFFSSAVSGAPSGSRLCAHLSETGVIDSSKLSFFCAACNMASPAFITGTLAALAGSGVVLPVLAGHYGASLIMLLFMRKALKPELKVYEQKPIKPFFTMLCDAIGEATLAAARICGVIVFFTVLLTLIIKVTMLLNISVQSRLYILLLSSFEMTNGCALISSLGLPYSVSCALYAACISFGGLCIMAQSGTVCQLSAKKYLPRKLLLSAIAGTLAYLVSLLIPRNEAVFSNGAETLGQAVTGSLSLAVIALSSLIGVGVVWLFCVSRARRA